MKKVIYTLLFLFTVSIFTTSCREEKSTGEKIEDVADDVADEVEDVVD